jgi:hypothetical protein
MAVWINYSHLIIDKRAIEKSPPPFQGEGIVLNIPFVQKTEQAPPYSLNIASNGLGAPLAR